MFEFWEQTEETWNLHNKKEITNIQKTSYKEIPVWELEDICFEYEQAVPILKGVSLSVQRGERIAIIGEIGSGKSTLLNILSGFYQPQKGTTKLLGMPMETLSIEEIRNRIAVINQKPYFFQGTIEENVNIDGKASHGEVVSACKKSGAIDFI